MLPPAAGPAVPSVVRGVELALLVPLTFAVGVVDALSLLGLGGVFTGNVSANVLLVGIGLSDQWPVDWFAALGAMLAFVAGAMAATVVQRGARQRWNTRTSLVLGAAAVAVLAVSLLDLLLPPVESLGGGLIATVLFAFAMGMQGAEATRLAFASMTTVTVSTTVIGVGVGLGLLLLGRPGESAPGGVPLGVKAAAVLALAAGGATGALILPWEFGIGALIAGGAMLLTVIAGHIRCVSFERARLGL